MAADPFGDCQSCAFWQLTADRTAEGYQNEGICRRHPPIAMPSTQIDPLGHTPAGGVGLIVAWPRTFGEEDWCGEYQADKNSGGKESAVVVSRADEVLAKLQQEVR